jgi:hypothetical protein
MLISTLKFVAILLSGLFAFFALLGDNRNRSGKLTTWGRIAVIGVIASTVVAAAIQTVETKRAIEADNKTREMITEIRRAAYPIVPPRPPTITFDVDVPLGDPALQAYRKRLQEMTRVLTDANGKTNWPATSLDISTELTTGKKRVEGLRFYGQSPALPHARSEPELASWLTQFGLDLDLSRRNELTQTFTTAESVDLRMRSLCMLNDLSFTYHRDEDALEINAACELENGAPIASNGRLVSIADLAGAHITVWFREAREGREMRKIAKLSGLSFVISNRHFSVSWDGNHETKNPMGFSRYDWVFPEDLLSAERVILR